MKRPEISDVTGMAMSVSQWCNVLAVKAQDLDTLAQHSERGEPLTEPERDAVENLCGHLQIAVGVFQDHIRTGQAVTGRPLPDDWKTRRIR